MLSATVTYASADIIDAAVFAGQYRFSLSLQPSFRSPGSGAAEAGDGAVEGDGNILQKGRCDSIQAAVVSL